LTEGFEREGISVFSLQILYIISEKSCKKILPGEQQDFSL